MIELGLRLGFGFGLRLGFGIGFRFGLRRVSVYKCIQVLMCPCLWLVEQHTLVIGVDMTVRVRFGLGFVVRIRVRG